MKVRERHNLGFLGPGESILRKSGFLGSTKIISGFSGSARHPVSGNSDVFQV